MDTRMGVEMELKVVKKDLQFASANSNTKVVDMVSPAPPYAPPAKFKSDAQFLQQFFHPALNCPKEWLQASVIRSLCVSEGPVIDGPVLGSLSIRLL
ncbi:unnamed protein product [Sphagnum jensenii]